LRSTTTSADARAANLLGALALAIVDRTQDAVAGAGVEGETTAAALSALHHFLGEPPIGTLRRAVGRTSPATVRMVDRLERAGNVERRASADDGRASHVALTPQGRKLARRVGRARQAVLEEALAGLTPEERAAFAGLLAKVMSTMVDAKLSSGEESAWTCRLCDPGACGREQGICPAFNAARAHVATLDQT
jgi:DNA-binding MarR family transcriptional regulator